jgi:hypothetical protein
MFFMLSAEGTNRVQKETIANVVYNLTAPRVIPLLIFMRIVTNHSNIVNLRIEKLTRLPSATKYLNGS